MNPILGLIIFLFVSSGDATAVMFEQKRYYSANDYLGFRVKSLYSIKNHVSQDFYKMPIVKPSKIVSETSPSGIFLSSESLKNSVYESAVLQVSDCKVAGSMDYSSDDITEFIKYIDDEYLGQIYVDGFAGFVKMTTPDGKVFMEQGYPVGGVLVNQGNTDPIGYAINNHIDFVVHYNDEEKSGQVTIVGFEMVPRSIHYKDEASVPTVCHQSPAPTMALRKSGESMQANPLHVIFTYSINWQRSSVKWSNRNSAMRENSLGNVANRVHWFSIINSIIVVVFLSGMVALILLRTLYHDFARYTQLATDENKEVDQEDSGWKLLHADVFRPPEHNKMLLSMTIGSGIQLFFSIASCLILALLSFALPDYATILRGLWNWILLFCSGVGAYWSAWYYKCWEGKSLRKNMMLTGFFYPCIFVALYTMSAAASHRDLSLASIISNGVNHAIQLALCIIPVFIGSFLGLRKVEYEAPVATSLIPREIPPQPWYLRPVSLLIIGGLVPFGVIFVEMYFFLSSLWNEQGYYLIGFLFIVLLILIVTTAEITVVLTYSIFCSENYHWWWMSVLAPGSSALYTLGFALYHSSVSLYMPSAMALVEVLGYLLLLVLAVFLLTGSIGFVASFKFVNTIFGSVKVD